MKNKDPKRGHIRDLVRLEVRVRVLWLKNTWWQEENKKKPGRLISDELSAGLLHWRCFPLCPAGGTSHRCYYFNYLLPGPSPWQPSPASSLTWGSSSAAPLPSLKSCLFTPPFERLPERFWIFGVAVIKQQHCWLTLWLSSPLIWRAVMQ